MANRERLIPSNIQKIGPTILHIIGIPIFCICFAMIFVPFHLDTLLDFPRATFQFNILICASIMLVILIFSRSTMCSVRKKIHLTWNWYIFWSLMELVFISFFTAMYVWLISPVHNTTYMMLVFKTVTILFSFLVIPFSIITLSLSLRYWETQQYIEEDIENTRVRFYDEKQNLKLVARKNSIFFIEADENYVNIHYLKGDKMKIFTLRSSMKAIESLCNEHQIVRCHRSYFINPKHIKILRKEKEGVTYVELDSIDGERIPVSKKYYDQIIELL